jgi:hypothetical protein
MNGQAVEMEHANLALTRRLPWFIDRNATVDIENGPRSAEIPERVVRSQAWLEPGTGYQDRTPYQSERDA